MARRRRFRRSFAGKRAGRRYFWFRDTPAGLTVREAASATHSDLLVDASFWDYQSTALNMTQRGGARLERLIIDFGLYVDGDDSFWAPAGDANIAIIPEFMLFVQSDQFVTVVTSSATFDSTRDDERILMDEIPTFADNTKDLAPGGRSIRGVRGRFETKVKARIADRAIGCAWRGFFDTGSANLNGYTDYVRTTFLISVP